MLHKNDAPAKLKLWLQSMQRLKVNIKHFSVIRSDNGGEFTDIDFQSVLTEFQISHERSPPDAHVQQVERSVEYLYEYLLILTSPNLWHSMMRIIL
jgi:hypothetical protein